MNPKTFIPPSGDIRTAKYIIIGEQPGYKEVRYGRPFIGPAGKELSDNLQAVGINRSADCYLTNVIKDLDNKLSYYIRFTAAGPTLSKEGLQYIEMLANELSDARENAVLIPTGNVALYAVANRTGITKWRGSVIKPTGVTSFRRWVVPTFHPATVIPPKCQYLNKILIQQDFKRAKDIFENDYEEPERTILIKPTLTEADHFLSRVIEKGRSGETIYYDIEIDRFNKQLTCISFCWKPNLVMSIPFIDNQGDYFSIQQEADLILKIARILEDPDIVKCGQNLVFDSTFLLRRYGIHSRNMQDTMIAQQTLMPEFRKGLDFVTSIWTTIPYYKAEGKEFLAGHGAWEQGWNYNAMDSVACAEAYPRQVAQLEKQKNYDTYNHQRQLIEPLAFMMENGIKINVEGMAAEYNNMESTILEKEQELNTLAGHPLNAKSPKQLAAYFYVEKGYYPYKGKRGSKGPSTDETAMKRLIRKGAKEAQYVLDIRRLTKLRSTYLDPTKVDPDGRMRCAYNPVGTLFSRLSSSQNIFGSGNNLQNQPHEVLKYFVADPGNVIYSIDLAQAENRIVAYAGRIESMIEAFERRLDLHSLTGALISGKKYEEVIDEDRSGTLCPLGGGDKTWRFWGKKANHGLNYDLGYRKFALYYEIPERDGRYIVEKYHSSYPGVRSGYHQHVRQQLAHGRTIRNLLGRRTLLLDEWGDSLFKKGYSCIPQGTVGDIINQRGLNYIYYNQDLFGPVRLMLQVHDSVGFQVPLSVGWTEHAKILLKIKQSLETPLTVHGREFVIPADISMGYTLYKGDMEEIKGLDCPTDVSEMAKLLETLNAKAIG